MVARLDIFAHALRQAREAEGHTQQEIADRVGVSVLQVKRWEAGASEPSLDMLRRVGYVLGGGVDVLIYDDAPKRHEWVQHDLMRRLQKLPPDDQAFVTRAFTALLTHAEQGSKSRAP